MASSAMWTTQEPGHVAGPVMYWTVSFSLPKVASLPNNVQPLSAGSSSSQKEKKEQLESRAHRALQASAESATERWAPRKSSIGEYLTFALKQPVKQHFLLQFNEYLGFTLCNENYFISLEAWASTSPHSHSYTSEESNYCRNPSGYSKGLW